MRVLKYKLSNDSPFSMPIAIGNVLTLKVQHNCPVLYVLSTDVKERNVNVEFYKVITGSDNPKIEGKTYVGTAMLDDGTYVCHYFITPTNGINVKPFER